MNFFFKILILCFILTTFTSCEDNQTEPQPTAVTSTDKRESLDKANRYVVKKEAEQISEYIERHRLNVQETGTGLRYQIIKNGDNTPIKRGDTVVLEYETKFLNGTLAYSSKEKGPKTFVVGHGGVESGLEEVMPFLHKNDVAVVILPSHLAFGLLGDGDKIPQKAAIVYKIMVKEVLSNNK